MAENKKNQTPCVAFDADVLRMLSAMHACLKKYPNYDFNKFKDDFIKRNHQDLLMLLNLIKTDQLHVFIGNTVFQQVKHRQEVCEFIKLYCYFPKLNVLTFNELLEKADDLASQYCSHYLFKGEKKYPPMDLNYSPISRKQAPSDDAYIMAEASIAGCMFITNNGKHFIFRENRKGDKNSRALGIITINKANHYCEELDNGETITPKPVLVRQFCEWIKTQGLDQIMMPDVDVNNFELGSNVL